MSNGQRCCALGVCCPPDSDSQRAGLVAEAEHALGSLTPTAENVVNWIMSEYDVVPKGVGEAIVNAYDPEFRKKYKPTV